jgi:D-serine deaminase-like pyridoxal phosphate-dependent protein
VEANIRQMLQIAGNPDSLRTHIKTHKMLEVIELQLRAGIRKFKCATIAEAELAAEAGVGDLLLAYQPVGPAASRIATLAQHFPRVQFSVLGDDAMTMRELSRTVGSISSESTKSGKPARSLEVLLDLDLGQHRTGIQPGTEAVELYRLISELPGLRPGGLHAYDGHLTESDPVRREAASDAAFAVVEALRARLEAQALPVPRIVAGGSPTFGFHAQRAHVECSPGTCVFWDAGYANKFPEFKFVPAALVLTRVVSKPGTKRLCLDLGHKAVGSEMPHPRVKFLNLEDAHAVLHSEEHLVVETDRSAEFRIGDCLYGVPWHICPTVALHSEAIIIEDGKSAGCWKVASRDRRLTV